MAGKDAGYVKACRRQAITVIGKGEVASRWCRPATACASRRTAGSRSSSSKAERTFHSQKRPGNSRPFRSCGPILTANIADDQRWPSIVQAMNDFPGGNMATDTWLRRGTRRDACAWRPRRCRRAPRRSSMSAAPTATRFTSCSSIRRTAISRRSRRSRFPASPRRRARRRWR